MVVPKSSGELISLGGVKWHEPLADYYSKHAQDLERNLADASNQRNQKAAIKAAESFVPTATKIGTTFTALVNAKNAIDNANKAKDVKDKKKYWASLNNEPWWIANNADLLKHKEYQYRIKKGEKFEGSAQQEIDRLAEQFKIENLPEVAQEILNASGRRLADQNELLARNAIAGASRASMLVDPDWEGADAWTAADKNTDKKDSIFKQYQLDKIEHLNLNDDAIAAVLGQELIRQSQTVRGTSKAAAVQAVSTADHRRIHTQLITANSVGSLEQGVWSARDDLIKSGNFKKNEYQTVNQQVDEYLYQTLDKLAADGFITESQLQPYIDSGFAHPAGPDGVSTPGKLLFNKDQVNGLVASARLGSGRHVAVKLSIAKNQLGGLKDEALRGGDVEARLQDIEHQFPELKEQIDDVRNTNVKDNTPEAYAVEKEDWEIELENGNIVASKEAAKLIKNKKLRDEVLAKIKLHEKVRDRVNYSERWIDIKVAEGMNLTLEADDPLNERGIKVRNDLLKYFRKDFQRRIETDPDNPEAFNDSIRAVETYWLANGGKNKDQKNTIQGKFTVTDDGRYEAYDEYSGLVSKRRQNSLLRSSKNNIKTWDNEIDQSWKVALTPNPQFPGKTTKERMLNMPGLLSSDDIIGAYENGILSQEIITKARRLGISGTSLLKVQTQALQNSDKGKDFKQLITQDMLDNFPSQEEAVAEAIQRTNNKDLLYLFYKVGPENWTPNQFQRVRNELAKQAEFESREMTTVQEGVNQIEQERRPETYTGTAY